MNSEQKNTPLTLAGLWLVLVTAFLGWFFAGMQLAVTSLVMRNAAKDLLGPEVAEADVAQLFGYLVCSFLFGAAAGGYVFGWVGDRMGRTKAMALSIFCYSLFSGATYFVNSPTQLLVLRFITCMGIGGMWPNGIAIVSEAWPKISKPILAGVIGTAANVGILCFALIACVRHITTDDWRWVMLFGMLPGVLGFVAWFMVPESPKWLAEKASGGGRKKDGGSKELVRLLGTTVVGILLGAVPLFGGWGNANWVNAWASQVGDETKKESQQDSDSGDKKEQDAPKKSTAPDPTLKARALIYRSLPGSISSLLGGGLAWLLGRKQSYFLLSLLALVCSLCLFQFSHPSDDPNFKYYTAALGFFSGFFFGWLPYCLPGLFPTRVRSTGAGISFNFGRILTALGILFISGMMKDFFGGDYRTIGTYTSFVYAIGLVVIWFAPDPLEEDD